MMRLLTLLALGFVLGLAAHADDKVQDCTKLWQLEKEAGCPAAPAEYSLNNKTPPVPVEFRPVKKTFDTNKCVPSEDVDTLVETLEDKCDKWAEKTEAKLAQKDRAFTNVCNHECSPCPKNPSLQKCVVTGEVTAKVKTAE